MRTESRQHFDARQRLERAEAVRDGFRRRRLDALARLVRVLAEAGTLAEAVEKSQAEDEALDGEVLLARSALEAVKAVER